MLRDETRQPQAPAGWFVAEDDIFETLPDGRVVQLAFKGTSMPMAEAERRGFAKVDQRVTPQEVKGRAFSIGQPPRGTAPAPGPSTTEPRVFAPDLPDDESDESKQVASKK